MFESIQAVICGGLALAARRGARERGFSLLELLIVMAVIGVLASAGVSGYSAYRKQTARAEAEALWQELSMAVNLYRMEEGRWPEEYTHVKSIAFLSQPLGALTVNLGPSNYGDVPRRIAEDMRGRPGGVGGTTEEHRSGHLILGGGLLCVWVDGYGAASNDVPCPDG